VSWIDWQHVDGDLLAFTRRLAELRRAHPAFRRRGWFQGRPIRHGARTALPDVAWFSADGTEMTDEHWDSDLSRTVQVFLDGHGILVPDERGEPIVDDTFLIVFHAAAEPGQITLPEARFGKVWSRVMDTERGFAIDSAHQPDRFEAGSKLDVVARSLWLLRREA